MKNLIHRNRSSAEFDESNLWLLIGVDLQKLKSDKIGFTNYEDREQGCTIALFNAYRKMLNQSDMQLLDDIALVNSLLYFQNQMFLMAVIRIL